jgi:hypothetical protein
LLSARAEAAALEFTLLLDLVGGTTTPVAPASPNPQLAGSGVDLTNTNCANIFANTLTGTAPLIRLEQTAGAFNVTQAAPTGLADPAQLDDANGITPAAITVLGTVSFAQPACVLP